MSDTLPQSPDPIAEFARKANDTAERMLTPDQKRDYLRAEIEAWLEREQVKRTKQEQLQALQDHIGSNMNISDAFREAANLMLRDELAKLSAEIAGGAVGEQVPVAAPAVISMQEHGQFAAVEDDGVLVGANDTIVGDSDLEIDGEAGVDTIVGGNGDDEIEGTGTEAVVDQSLRESSEMSEEELKIAAAKAAAEKAKRAEKTKQNVLVETFNTVSDGIASVMPEKWDPEKKKKLAKVITGVGTVATIGIGLAMVASAINSVRQVGLAKAAKVGVAGTVLAAVLGLLGIKLYKDGTLGAIAEKGKDAAGVVWGKAKEGGAVAAGAGRDLYNKGREALDGSDQTEEETRIEEQQEREIFYAHVAPRLMPLYGDFADIEAPDEMKINDIYDDATRNTFSSVLQGLDQKPMGEILDLIGPNGVKISKHTADRLLVLSGKGFEKGEKGRDDQVKVCHFILKVIHSHAPKIKEAYDNMKDTEVGKRFEGKEYEELPLGDALVLTVHSAETAVSQVLGSVYSKAKQLGIRSWTGLVSGEFKDAIKDAYNEVEQDAHDYMHAEINALLSNVSDPELKKQIRQDVLFSYFSSVGNDPFTVVKGKIESGNFKTEAVGQKPLNPGEQELLRIVIRKTENTLLDSNNNFLKTACDNDEKILQHYDVLIASNKLQFKDVLQLFYIGEKKSMMALRMKLLHLFAKYDDEAFAYSSSKLLTNSIGVATKKTLAYITENASLPPATLKMYRMMRRRFYHEGKGLGEQIWGVMQTTEFKVGAAGVATIGAMQNMNLIPQQAHNFWRRSSMRVLDTLDTFAGDGIMKWRSILSKWAPGQLGELRNAANGAKVDLGKVINQVSNANNPALRKTFDKFMQLGDFTDDAWKQLHAIMKTQGASDEVLTSLKVLQDTHSTTLTRARWGIINRIVQYVTNNRLATALLGTNEGKKIADLRKLAHKAMVDAIAKGTHSIDDFIKAGVQFEDLLKSGAATIDDLLKLKLPDGAKITLQTILNGCGDSKVFLNAFEESCNALSGAAKWNRFNILRSIMSADELLDAGMTMKRWTQLGGSVDDFNDLRKAAEAARAAAKASPGLKAGAEAVEHVDEAAKLVSRILEFFKSKGFTQAGQQLKKFMDTVRSSATTSTSAQKILKFINVKGLRGLTTGLRISKTSAALGGIGIAIDMILIAINEYEKQYVLDEHGNLAEYQILEARGQTLQNSACIGAGLMFASGPLLYATLPVYIGTSFYVEAAYDSMREWEKQPDQFMKENDNATLMQRIVDQRGADWADPLRSRFLGNALFSIRGASPEDLEYDREQIEMKNRNMRENMYMAYYLKHADQLLTPDDYEVMQATIRIAIAEKENLKESDYQRLWKNQIKHKIRENVTMKRRAYLSMMTDHEYGATSPDRLHEADVFAELSSIRQRMYLEQYELAKESGEVENQREFDDKGLFNPHYVYFDENGSQRSLDLSDMDTTGKITDEGVAERIRSTVRKYRTEVRPLEDLRNFESMNEVAIQEGRSVDDEIKKKLMLDMRHRIHRSEQVLRLSSLSHKKVNAIRFELWRDSREVVEIVQDTIRMNNMDLDRYKESLEQLDSIFASVHTKNNGYDKCKNPLSLALNPSRTVRRDKLTTSERYAKYEAMIEAKVGGPIEDCLLGLIPATKTRTKGYSKRNDPDLQAAA